MRKKLALLIVLSSLLLGGFNSINLSYAASTSTDFTVPRDVDKGTFNEYRLKIIRDFFRLREVFDVDGFIDENAANRILTNVRAGYKYLPDDLINEDNYNVLSTALKRGIKSPNNEAYYAAIKKALNNFVYEASIQEVEGTIYAEPTTGNAPLITTLRANVEDPSGTKLSSTAYTWWVDIGGRKTIIGTKPSIGYTFTQEGTYSVFLNVKSSHKNSQGVVDVLPYEGEVKIQVKEKIASVILRVGGQKIPSNDEIKFSPEEANYGLIFDAASSVPSTGAKFLNTSWDFGNGVTKSYRGSPRIERVIYAREGDYDPILSLETNGGDIIEKRFKVIVHKPIATIDVSQDNGYMGDKFIFRAKTHGSKKNLAYAWEIIDLARDEIILKKTGNLFNYSFKEKGRYSIRLKITDASGFFDIDTKDIYINSREPVPHIKTTIPLSNKPNEVFFDATSTFDPDYGDDGNLKYSWTIDGSKVNLEKSNDNGSTGYYTFDSIGEHSIALEVEDPDGMTALTKESVDIKSTLSLDFVTYPRVIQREGFIKFVANSPNAKFYEWDFGDGSTKGGSNDTINHSYEKSGVFKVKLTVRGNDNKSNSHTKLVYVGDSKNPVSVITLSKQQGFEFVKKEGVCNGNDAYLVSRKDNVTFSSAESINTDGKNSGLEFSWKLGKEKYSSGPKLTSTFDELGCTSIKLTVKSTKDKTTDAQTVWVKVDNLEPSLSGLTISPVDINSDPVVVNLAAIGAQDKDGVIQSYLWYYTTDADNEAQDFRVTKGPATTFVLPKIPGNYYFEVVLKDNNDAKVASEDLIGKNSITLAGDNVNTPLIEFSTTDSSVGVGETVAFKAEAENVLGKSIEKDSKFSWDFDGDGFYEKETETGEANYKYKSSGTFYPKVKVKHKGYSNTRTLTINVANKLVSDFSYISIGNKYVFLDKSRGVVDHLAWDLGDGTKEQNKTNFIHSYDDKKSVHSVELSVAEGTKTKKSTKEVKRNVKNILKARKKGINAFSYPEVDSEGVISLDEEESIFIYMGESNGEFEFYGIDYDIDIDSDINGGKDDDIDNINNSSYKSGDPDEIVLNKKRKQTLRLFLLDGELNTVDSKDIIIEKKYIEEQDEIDPTSIKFEGVSDEVKIKIEKLKNMVSKLSQENRIQGMLYIQKMQEIWDDETEKTRTLIEFEQFLAETGDESADDIIVLLESLLLEEGDKDDEKTVAFRALEALIPDSIQCSTGGETCKEMLIVKLEEIKLSSDVEGNRAIGTEILEVIAIDKTMTDKEKQDFKAVLQVLVYSGVDNIPEEVVDGVKEGDEKNPAVSEGESGKLMSFLKKLGYWAAWIVGVILIGMFVFWIIDFLKNRKSGESFEDFVSEKTTDDVLGSDVKEEVDPLVSEKKSDEDELDLGNSGGMFTAKENNDTKNSALTSDEENIKNESVEDENIPDWLSGNIEESDSISTVDKGKRDDVLSQKEQEEENVGISLSEPGSELNQQNDKTKEFKKNEEVDDFNLDDETKIGDETPDWLKDSLTDKLPHKKELSEEEVLEKNKFDQTDTTNITDKTEKEPVIIEDEEEKLDLENDTPDWLKDSSNNNDYTDESENKLTGKNTSDKSKNIKGNQEKDAIDDGSGNSVVDEDVPDWLKDSGVDNDVNISEGKNTSPTKRKQRNSNKGIKQANNKQTTKGKSTQKIKGTPKKIEIKEDKKISIKKNNDDTIASESNSDDSIPDWLKGSIDNEEVEVEKVKNKKPKAMDKKPNNKTSNKSDTENVHYQPDTQKLEDADVPDWLKASLDEDSIDTGAKKDISTEKKKPQTKKEEDQMKKKTNKKTPQKTNEKKSSQKKEEGIDKESNSSKKDELWDDGMTVPDWLKTEEK